MKIVSHRNMFIWKNKSNKMEEVRINSLRGKKSPFPKNAEFIICTANMSQDNRKIALDITAGHKVSAFKMDPLPADMPLLHFKKMVEWSVKPGKKAVLPVTKTDEATIARLVKKYNSSTIKAIADLAKK